MEIDAIAGAGMAISAAQTAESVELAILKKAMEAEQMAAAQMIQAIEAAGPAPASFGHKLDVLA